MGRGMGRTTCVFALLMHHFRGVEMRLEREFELSQKRRNPAFLRGFRGYGRGWIRTIEGISHQIYSLTRLATSVHARPRGIAVYRFPWRSVPRSPVAGCCYGRP